MIYLEKAMNTKELFRIILLTRVKHIIIIKFNKAADVEDTILACFLRKEPPPPYITDTRDSL